MKPLFTGVLLTLLATQTSLNETRMMDLTGNIDNNPAVEIVRYRGNPEKRSSISSHNVLKPGEKWNNLLIYEKLDKPENPYTELTINGKLTYAKFVKGFHWQGPYIERIRLADVTNDGIPDVFMVCPGHRDGKVVSYNSKTGLYEMRNLVVVEDKEKEF